MAILIAITGGSGSGKSTLAEALVSALPPGAAVLVREDSYYRDAASLPGFDAATFDFDDVATDFILKMRARQPYLFDGTVAEGEMVSEEEQERLWTYGRGRPRSNPATQLPALTLAEEAIRRARALGCRRR